MNLREAAQMALDALERTDKIRGHGNNRKAITTLRAALAENATQRLSDVQQEMDCYGDGNVYRGQRSKDSKTQTIMFSESKAVEPVAFIHKDFTRRIREVLTQEDFIGNKSAFLKYCMSDENLLPLYLAPLKREPLTGAEKMVEPVAWITPRQELHLVNYEGFQDWVPLYTAPPQRKPLTDEEIYALDLPPSGTATVRDLVRLIERAHGIGGEE